MSEEWRPVPGHPAYEVSNLGRVRSSMSGVFKTMMPTDCAGYATVELRDLGRRERVRVHRLVLLAFSGPPPTDAHQACHWNGVRDDNRLDNLRWGTWHENHADAVRHGTATVGERHNHAKLREDDVRMIRKLLATGEGPAAIARLFGMSLGAIMAIREGRSWRCVS